MDFIDRVKDSINQIPNLPIQIRKGYLGIDETLVIYGLPGSRVVREYMDGEKELELNYEIAMKSQNGQKIENTLWMISDYLDSVKAIQSNDGSFEFNGLAVTSKPYINQADQQNWFVFLLTFTANVTTEEEKVNVI
ncbi:minor capsid protein [Marinilactibacillus psychrotolerans]|uniref:phage tail terminator protein n=1 Tax=Marinilactibacillus psychrotolerans TaxID=191770 RepID=UPI0038842DF8